MLAPKVLQQAPARQQEGPSVQHLSGVSTISVPGPTASRAGKFHHRELTRLQKQYPSRVTRPSRFEDKELKSWLSQEYVPASQRWSAKLQQDVVAVCSEAGLSHAATRAVVAAAARGAISQNPGVLLPRLLSFSQQLSGPMGRRATLALVRVAPTLLNSSPESLKLNAEMLGSLLPEEAVAGAVVRAPGLLLASSFTLWTNFESLRTALRLPHDAALALVGRQPRLLLPSAAAMRGRVAALALLAGTCTSTLSRRGAGTSALGALALRQPGLLSYYPATLQGNMQHLASELGVPFEAVQRLLVKQPGVVMLSRGRVSAKLAALRQALAHMPEAEVLAMVLKQPGLLSLSVENVAAKVALVGKLLLPPAAAAAPGCGAAAGAAAGCSLGVPAAEEEEQERQGRRQEALCAALRAAPQLLTLSAISLEAKMGVLRGAATHCPALRAQLEATPTATLGWWLCYSMPRFERVRAAAASAAATGGDGGLAVGSLSFLLSATDAAYGAALARVEAAAAAAGASAPAARPSSSL